MVAPDQERDGRDANRTERDGAVAEQLWECTAISSEMMPKPGGS